MPDQPKREVVCLHRVISDQCRANHGDDEIIKAMTDAFRIKLTDALRGWPTDIGTRFTIKLTLEP